jgi:DNA processing protein
LRVCAREDAEQEIAAAQRLGARFVALGEADYPAYLQAIDDAPPLLAVRGNAGVLRGPLVAMVGSRNASAAGVKMAERLARELGAAGFGVASGLARGIDAAAHRASLATGTVAVLAGGQDRVYPPEHASLVDALLESGVAICEMPFGWEPRARDFPRRNRLISGVSLGVVVIEAAKKSGSLITARMALEQNREVFAVPGSPLDPRAEGANGLLKQGAVLVTEVEDIVNVLRPIIGHPPEQPMEEPEPAAPADAPAASARARIIALMEPTPVAIDDLIRLSGCSPAAVQTALLELELAGRLDRQRGGLVALLTWKCREAALARKSSRSDPGDVDGRLAHAVDAASLGSRPPQPSLSTVVLHHFTFLTVAHPPGIFVRCRAMRVLRFDRRGAFTHFPCGEA